MRKGIAAVIVVALFAFTFHMGMGVGANNSEPGSAGDPLITESYLEKRLQEVSGGSSSTGSVQASFQEVKVKAGKVLSIKKGTEVVLYSGSADVSGGTFVNLSTGTVFKSGNSFVKYNSILGVGSNSSIKAVSDITVFIRGSYESK